MKTILIFIFSISISAKAQDRFLNQTFYGYWTETEWKYEFYENKKFRATSSGHFGIDTAEGFYRIKNDSLIVDSITRRGFIAKGDSWIIEKDSCIIDLVSGYDHCKNRETKIIKNSDGTWTEEIQPGRIRTNKEILRENKNVLLDDVQILQDIERHDSITYPSNKFYQNNSSSIKYQDLYQLLDQRSDNKLFKKLWNKLGNDSAVKTFDDCFFINYEFEGLSFRFDKDSTLSTIFIEDSYEGEFPYRIKFGDLKSSVEEKIGESIISGKYGDNTWVRYKDQSLYIDYDGDQRITKITIISKK